MYDKYRYLIMYCTYYVNTQYIYIYIYIHIHMEHALCATFRGHLRLIKAVALWSTALMTSEAYLGPQDSQPPFFCVMHGAHVISFTWEI